jgi:uncharacterized protein YdeI (YjbR/CyaY-like superfamily)
MPRTDALSFASREEWRQWLALNHGSSGGVWLYVHKKGSSTRGLRYEEAVEEALCFGWIDSRVRAHDADRFVQWFSPRKEGSIWSETNRRRVARLAKRGTMVEAGLRSVRVAKRNGMWDTLPNRSDDPEPGADLREALRADPAAWRGWRSFTPSYRKMYLYWVDDAKRPQTRERRIAEVVRRSREGRKPGML